MSKFFDFIDTKKLAARIAELQEELTHLLDLHKLAGSKTKGKPGRKPKAVKITVKTSKRKAGGKRGGVKDSILKFLESKGKDGAHVNDIAKHVGKKPVNITSFFFTTGKKIKEIKKVAPATYSYVP